MKLKRIIPVFMAAAVLTGCEREPVPVSNYTDTGINNFHDGVSYSFGNGLTSIFGRLESAGLYFRKDGDKTIYHYDVLDDAIAEVTRAPSPGHVNQGLGRTYVSRQTLNSKKNAPVKIDSLIKHFCNQIDEHISSVQLRKFETMEKQQTNDITVNRLNYFSKKRCNSI